MLPSFIYPEIEPTRLQKVVEMKILHGDTNNRWYSNFHIMEVVKTILISRPWRNEAISDKISSCGHVFEGIQLDNSKRRVSDYDGHH